MEPPIDKSFEGITKQMRREITDLTRRLGKSSTPDTGPRQPITTEITDWNAATEVGFYSGTAAANSPTPDDGGGAGWWSGVVTTHPGNASGPRIFQEVREGRLARSGIVYRRYWDGTSWSAWATEDPIRRGTAARRAATVSRYWEFWQDTDGTQLLYIGNKTGGWRRFSGTATSPSAAWSTLQGTAPAAIIAGRTATMTIDTVLETTESLIVTAASVGSGFGIASLNIVTKNATSTDITVRLMQLGSATTQQFTLNWQIIQA